MEQFKKFLLFIIVAQFAVIGLVASKRFQENGGHFSPTPNWQWSDDWNSNQISPPPNSMNGVQPNIPPNVSPPIMPHQRPHTRPDGPRNNGPIQVRSLDEAQSAAQQNGKHILMFFTAEWCGWCTKLKNETLSDPQIQQDIANFVYYVVDTDREPQVASQFNVSGMPTMIICDSSLSVLRKESGYMDTNKMSNFLR